MKAAKSTPPLPKKQADTKKVSLFLATILAALFFGQIASTLHFIFTSYRSIDMFLPLLTLSLWAMVFFVSLALIVQLHAASTVKKFSTALLTTALAYFVITILLFVLPLLIDIGERISTSTSIPLIGSLAFLLLYFQARKSP